MAYIDSTALARAIGADTLKALCDDDNDGVADAAVVTAVIERADAEADSWIAGVYDVAIPVASPPQQLKNLSLAYAIAFCYARNPDYLRAFNQAASPKELLERADRLGARIQSSIQRMPSVADPDNVGGLVITPEPRLLTQDTDGTHNGGDF